MRARFCSASLMFTRVLMVGLAIVSPQVVAALAAVHVRVHAPHVVPHRTARVSSPPAKGVTPARDLPGLLELLPRAVSAQSPQDVAPPAGGEPIRNEFWSCHSSVPPASLSRRRG